ncbi:type II secretion system minor pseudopilin GspI [Corallincola spongiicola]|uniref:Type II secretion system protein I n=1 Tax=Corallincola spongiicola TaxID=2520508 RepID=A0ABY1WPQ7_9GAMM|nr:type II secretion system minor pseudopilin GspI [Corallincola spongiicola]TAA46073.1 type II secretion system protein GspI [Corallincola spongiicola]
MINSRGMTLLEVLVALAIFASAAISLAQATTGHINSLFYLEQSSMATWVASNRMTEIALEKEWPKLSVTRGTMEMAGHTWHWTQQGLETPDKELRGVRVEVFYEEKDKSPLASVVSYRSKS